MKTLAFIPLALVAAPALAQSQDYPPPPNYDQAHDQRYADPRADDRRADDHYADERYADERDAPRGPVDPSTARAMAGAVQAVTDAILDVRIDGVRRAADPYARNDGSRTIGDLMAKRDPAYREHLHQDMTRAARTAAGAARAGGEVKAAADEFARRIERVLNESGY